MRRILPGFILGASLLAAACGGTTAPSPPVNGGGNNGGGGQVPAPNVPPVVDSITVQGSRSKEPTNFADVGEAVQLTATVHDAETPVAQLQFQWAASAGTISGAGASVTYSAPASAPAQPVTLTLTVLENFGTGATAGQNKTTATATVQVHDSIKEIGDMSRQFLLDFSDTNIKDADFILRNFSRSRCPDPREVDSERSDVTNNFTNFVMQAFRIGPAAVNVGFGTTCATNHGPKRGDACAVVPSMWDSIDRRDNIRRAVDGNDIVAAAFSAADNRWWLCSSDYDGHLVSGPPFTLRSYFWK